MKFTLIIMVILGYDFQKNPVAVNIESVPGFTTEQACLNAAAKVTRQFPNGFRSTDRKFSTVCVVDTI